jgi:DNA repair exonuclease SbcCD nuclease subunit
MTRPIAILTSDLHVSLKPPRIRCDEPDWMKAQVRMLQEISEVADRHNCPVLCAGDVFDRWDSPAELINMMIRHAPNMVCVPGHHDMPFHDPNEMDKSAYQTLVEAGKIIDVPAGTTYITKGCRLAVTGFPWGTDLQPCHRHEAGVFQVALIHKYVWLDSRTGYPGVSEDSRLTNIKESLEGYDLALFGDNHKAFYVLDPKTGLRVYNHGNMQRRTVEEALTIPRYGVLYENGIVDQVLLRSAKKDKISLPSEKEETTEDDMEAIQDFIKQLRHSVDSRFDFQDAIMRYIYEHKPSKAVVTVLKRAIRKGD